MKTLYSVFEDINLDMCSNQCLLSIGTQALVPKVNLFDRLFGQIKISRSGIKRSLMLISKAIIKESLGAELDIKLIIMLFAGYLSLVKQPSSLLKIKAFQSRSASSFINTQLLAID
ncbi:hypothetical protein [Mucilaginibacter endophyticus]|uniref:hypothetical protein n=1 Tax=Mucilaginibacter endophyticus TaxID=2675003 RepID=UPI000E0DC710|nr:hypothetical protein [Mucilaginibacter endophyticus]